MPGIAHFPAPVVVFLLALHHHRCLHRHRLRLLQRLGPAGQSEEHQVDDGLAGLGPEGFHNMVMVK